MDCCSGMVPKRQQHPKRKTTRSIRLPSKRKLDYSLPVTRTCSSTSKTPKAKSIDDTFQEFRETFDPDCEEPTDRRHVVFRDQDSGDFVSSDQEETSNTSCGSSTDNLSSESSEESQSDQTPDIGDILDDDDTLTWAKRLFHSQKLTDEKNRPELKCFREEVKFLKRKRSTDINYD